MVNCRQVSSRQILHTDYKIGGQVGGRQSVSWQIQRNRKTGVDGRHVGGRQILHNQEKIG